MTRERAIELIGSMKGDLCDFYDDDDLTALEMAISALSAEPCREVDDYENEIADLHNRLDIAEYDKERYKEEITTLEAENKAEWIPVSERLPKNADVYRVTRRLFDNRIDTEPFYMVDACFFDGTNTWHNDNRINHERGYADDVIAWQENPEPYKAEKGGKGEWIHPYRSDIACECSVCHIQIPITDYFHYCPNCGADMRGET